MHSYLHGHPSLIHAVRRLERLNPDQFELYFERRNTLNIDARDAKVETLTQAEDVGLSVRLVKDKRLGFSFTTSLEIGAIDRAVDAASEIAAQMPEDEFVGLHSFGTSVYPDVDALDTQGLRLATEQKVALALKIEAECRKADSRITAVRKATLRQTSLEVRMIDSSGEQLHHQGSYFTGSISCKAEQDGDSQLGGEMGFSNYLDNVDATAIGRQAASFATELLKAGQAPSMRCPAVLRNSVVTDLLQFLSTSFSAEQVAKGRSMLAGKLGARVFAENITLIDDGLLPGGYGTSPFDAEGIPSSATTLVDGGFLSDFLYDSYYARKTGKEPSGTTGRSIKSPPSIGVSNFYLKKGKKPFEKLIDGIDKGILITELMGLHTANPVTGEFSLGAAGILIEKGKLTRAVRGFAVAGNVLGLFHAVTDIGSDLKFYGTVGAPSVRIAELSISGT